MRLILCGNCKKSLIYFSLKLLIIIVNYFSLNYFLCLDTALSDTLIQTSSLPAVPYHVNILKLNNTQSNILIRPLNQLKHAAPLLTRSYNVNDSPRAYSNQPCEIPGNALDRIFILESKSTQH